MKTLQRRTIVLIIVSLLVLGLLIISRNEQLRLLASSPFRSFRTNPDAAYLEPTPTGKVFPTSLPTQKISSSIPSEVHILNNTLEIEKLFSPDLDGTQMVAQAKVANGLGIVQIDLDTGKVDLLSTPQELLGTPPKISGHKVVWSEPVNLAQSQYQLYVYDLSSNQLTQPYVLDYYHHLDFTDDIAVWEGTVGQTSGIYGYNVTTNQAITIAQTLVGYPRIAYPWTIYLDYNAGTLGERRQDQAAKLWACNLETQERFEVGTTFNPDDATAGSYHALDTHWVAWFGTDSNADSNVASYQPYVYDLSTHSLYTPTLPIQWPPRVLLSNNVAVFGNVGLDLATYEAFNVISIPEIADMTGIPLLLSEENLVWLWDDGETMQKIYHSRITRR